MSVVLDVFVIIVMFKGECGVVKVVVEIGGVWVSSVNYVEVVSYFVYVGMFECEVDVMFDLLLLMVVLVDKVFV